MTQHPIELALPRANPYPYPNPNPNPNHHQEAKAEPEQRSEFSLRVEALNPGQLSHAGPLPRSKVRK